MWFFAKTKAILAPVESVESLSQSLLSMTDEVQRSSRPNNVDQQWFQMIEKLLKEISPEGKENSNLQKFLCKKQQCHPSFVALCNITRKIPDFSIALSLLGLLTEAFSLALSHQRSSLFESTFEMLAASIQHWINRAPAESLKIPRDVSQKYLASLTRGLAALVTFKIESEGEPTEREWMVDGIESLSALSLRLEDPLALLYTLDALKAFLISESFISSSSQRIYHLFEKTLVPGLASCCVNACKPVPTAQPELFIAIALALVSLFDFVARFARRRSVAMDLPHLITQQVLDSVLIPLLQQSRPEHFNAACEFTALLLQNLKGKEFRQIIVSHLLKTSSKNILDWIQSGQLGTSTARHSLQLLTICLKLAPVETLQIVESTGKQKQRELKPSPLGTLQCPLILDEGLYAATIHHEMHDAVIHHVQSHWVRSLKSTATTNSHCYPHRLISIVSTLSNHFFEAEDIAALSFLTELVLSLLAAFDPERIATLLAPGEPLTQSLAALRVICTEQLCDLGLRKAVVRRARASTMRLSKERLMVGGPQVWGGIILIQFQHELNMFITLLLQCAPPQTKRAVGYARRSDPIPRSPRQQAMTQKQPNRSSVRKFPQLPKEQAAAKKESNRSSVGRGRPSGKRVVGYQQQKQSEQSTKKVIVSRQ